MKKLQVSAGEGRCKVTLDAVFADGQGCTAFLYGGELPHVGGVALASPGPEIHGQQLSSVDLWQLTVPGHKDAEAAALVAKRLCKELAQPVSVTCGIHIDDATPEELQQIARNCEQATEALIKRLA